MLLGLYPCYDGPDVIAVVPRRGFERQREQIEIHLKRLSSIETDVNLIRH